MDIPQNTIVGQQRQQISELQFDKFPNPQSIFVWKIRFKNQVTTCSDVPSETFIWINEVGAHDPELYYADLFSVVLQDDYVQEFDTRWDEVLLSMSKIPPMISWKVCTN